MALTLRSIPIAISLHSMRFFVENWYTYSVSQENPDSHSTMRVRILLGHTVLDITYVVSYEIWGGIKNSTTSFPLLCVCNSANSMHFPFGKMLSNSSNLSTKKFENQKSFQ